MAEEQIVMIQALQAQMEELRQEGIADQLRHEEDRRKQEEEVTHLKEQNKRLLQRLVESEREEYFHTPIPTTQTHQSRTVPLTLQTHETHYASFTHPTNRSFRHMATYNEENPKGHPFTDDIIVAPLPDKWRCFIMNLYDGSTNPNEHFNIFRTQMNLYTIDQTVWCKVFPTSLREGPLGWFTELPPNFVASFKVLETKFIT